MRRFLLVVFITLLAGICHGQSLVDLTPGGFEYVPGHQLPPRWYKAPWDRMHYFDEAVQGWFPDYPNPDRYLNGWISVYGDPNFPNPQLPGGAFFFTNLFMLRSPTTATIWWSFIGAPTGYSLGVIRTWGRRTNGATWMHLYQVRTRFTGEARVTVDGQTPIMSIAFYGYEQ